MAGEKRGVQSTLSTNCIAERQSRYGNAFKNAVNELSECSNIAPHRTVSHVLYCSTSSEIATTEKMISPSATFESRRSIVFRCEKNQA